MGQKTALYDRHCTAGARLVDFGGWDMPIQYTSLIEEHNAVRQHAGVFDVSHMTIVDVTGDDAEPWLRWMLANDVARLGQPGQALYTAMLNDTGGVIDDLIVYRLRNGYRLVVNCATREKDLAWLQGHIESHQATLTERPELAILAVQGPKALKIVDDILRSRGEPELADAVQSLKPFTAAENDQWLVARTGYTGENGVEIILPESQAPELWDALLEAGVRPIGLGARDTLRLEAGMNLYGHEMDESVSPLSANMGWTIALKPEDRDFVGRSAVALHADQLTDGSLPVLAGLVMTERGVLREGMRVVCTLEDGSTADGITTSGTFSPTLKHAIALARIPTGTTQCAVEIRGKLLPVRTVKPGFVRHGKQIFD
ncbi:MAG: glycine cleavage system protein T [Gammaproteobacteria bacterium]|nr:glycine cleavage system protein T [Gammaproteobacteria bacterium]MBJ55790.1 glycine cleavage system protein T [Gammaproteobacteria bacterium]